MSLDALRGTTTSGASCDTSTSDSSDGYPKREERVPFIVIWRDEGGCVKYAHRPQNNHLTLTFIKEDSESRWELTAVPEHFERHWMDPNSFRRVHYIVESVLDRDLRKMLKEDAEMALRAIDESARVYETDRSISETRPCPVCSEDLHPVWDDFEQLNGKRVCTDHSISELKNSGLLDQGGMPRNRIWE